MLNHLTLIFGCQLAGELVTRAAEIPVPGPVLGMAILFCFLLYRGTIPEKLSETADALLNHLSLLFVPAGVGVMLHFQLLGDDWLPIGVALVVSTLLTLVVTSLMMSWLGKRSPAAPDGPAGD
jgi:putative effector of murein hydrolase LrgA (UPF0299 family)